MEALLKEMNGGKVPEDMNPSLEAYKKIPIEPALTSGNPNVQRSAQPASPAQPRTTAPPAQTRTRTRTAREQELLNQLKPSPPKEETTASRRREVGKPFSWSDGNTYVPIVYPDNQQKYYALVPNGHNAEEVRNQIVDKKFGGTVYESQNGVINKDRYKVYAIETDWNKLKNREINTDEFARRLTKLYQDGYIDRTQFQSYQRRHLDRRDSHVRQAPTSSELNRRSSAREDAKRSYERATRGTELAQDAISINVENTANAEERRTAYNIQKDVPKLNPTLINTDGGSATSVGGTLATQTLSRNTEADNTKISEWLNRVKGQQSQIKNELLASDNKISSLQSRLNSGTPAQQNAVARQLREAINEKAVLQGRLTGLVNGIDSAISKNAAFAEAVQSDYIKDQGMWNALVANPFEKAGKEFKSQLLNSMLQNASTSPTPTTHAFFNKGTGGVSHIQTQERPFVEVMGGLSSDVASLFGYKPTNQQLATDIADTNRAVEDVPVGPLEQAFNNPNTDAADALSLSTNNLSLMVQQGIGQLPAQALPTLIGLGTGGWGELAAYAGVAIGTGLQEGLHAAQEFMGKKKLDPKNANDVLKLYQDPKLLQELRDFQLAKGLGTSSGESAVSFLAYLVSKKLPLTGKAVVQALKEIPQEGMGAIASNIAVNVSEGKDPLSDIDFNSAGKESIAAISGMGTSTVSELRGAINDYRKEAIQKAIGIISNYHNISGRNQLATQLPSGVVVRSVVRNGKVGYSVTDKDGKKVPKSIERQSLIEYSKFLTPTATSESNTVNINEPDTVREPQTQTINEPQTQSIGEPQTVTAGQDLAVEGIDSNVGYANAADLLQGLFANPQNIQTAENQNIEALPPTEELPPRNITQDVGEVAQAPVSVPEVAPAPQENPIKSVQDLRIGTEFTMHGSKWRVTSIYEKGVGISMVDNKKMKSRITNRDMNDFITKGTADFGTTNTAQEATTPQLGLDLGTPQDQVQSVPQPSAVPTVGHELAVEEPATKAEAPAPVQEPATITQPQTPKQDESTKPASPVGDNKQEDQLGRKDAVQGLPAAQSTETPNRAGDTTTDTKTEKRDTGVANSVSGEVSSNVQGSDANESVVKGNATTESVSQKDTANDKGSVDSPLAQDSNESPKSKVNHPIPEKSILPTNQLHKETMVAMGVFYKNAGITDLQDFTNQLVQDFGENALPFARGMFDASKKTEENTTVANKRDLEWVYQSLFGLSKEQAQAASEVADLMYQQIAKREGISLTDAYKRVKYAKAENGVSNTMPQNSKGAVTNAGRNPNKDAVAVIYAMTSPDVSTPLHELAHVFEGYLSEEEANTVLEWAETPTWTRETSEKFARGFERFLKDGVSDKKMQGIFDKFKTWLTDIYDRVKNTLINRNLTDEMRKVYSDMLGIETAKPKTDEKTQSSSSTGTKESSERVQDSKTDASPNNMATEEEVSKRTGLTQEAIKRIRERFGFKATEAPDRITFKNMFEQEMASGEWRMFDNILDELSIENSSRVLSPKEHTQAVIYEAHLLNSIDDIMSSELLTDEIKAVKVAVLEHKLDALTFALNKSGTNAGRALSFRRMMVNRDTMTLDKVLQRARLKAKGADGKGTLSDKARQQIVDAHNEYSRIETMFNDAVKAFEAGQEAITLQDKINAERAVKRLSKEKAQGTIEERKKGIFQRLLGLGYRIKKGVGTLFQMDISDLSNGISPELAKSIRDLAKVLIDGKKTGQLDLWERAGMNVGEGEADLTTIVDAIHNLIEDSDGNKMNKVVIIRSLAGVGISKIQQVSMIRERRAKMQRLKRSAKIIASIKRDSSPDAIAQAQAVLTDALGNDGMELAFSLGEKDYEQAQQKAQDRINQKLQEISDSIQAIHDGTFVQEKKERMQDSPETKRLRAKLNIERKKLNDIIEAQIPTSTKEKILTVLWEATTLPKTLKATLDISGVARQGFFLSIRHPQKALEAYKTALQAMFDPVVAQQIEDSIHDSPFFGIASRAGLYFTALDAHAEFTLRDENFASNLAHKIGVIRGSERHMATYLNMLRLHAFETFMLTHDSVTDEEMKAMAHFINVASGRGGNFSDPKIQLATNMMFFSMRFANSRFQTIWAGTFKAMPKRVKMEAMRTFWSGIAFGMGIYGLSSLLGFGGSDDPEDADFGKIVIPLKNAEDVHIDLFAGEQQASRFAYKTLTRVLAMAGIIKPSPRQKSESLGKVTIDYWLESKSNPFVQFAFETYNNRRITALSDMLLSTKDAEDKALDKPSYLIKPTGAYKYVVKDLMNKPEYDLTHNRWYTMPEVLINAFTPISVPNTFGSAYNGYKEAGALGIAGGLMLSAMEVHGAGINTYDKGAAFVNTEGVGLKSIDSFIEQYNKVKPKDASEVEFDAKLNVLKGKLDDGTPIKYDSKEYAEAQKVYMEHLQSVLNGETPIERYAKGNSQENYEKALEDMPLAKRRVYRSLIRVRGNAKVFNPSGLSLMTDPTDQYQAIEILRSVKSGATKSFKNGVGSSYYLELPKRKE